VRRNMEKPSQDQARHYNLRRRQWSPAVGDIVWAKEHHLSKAAEGFAAKLAPRYDGPYQVVDFVSPVICKICHTVEERKDSSRWRAQPTTKRANCRNVRLSNDRYEATGLCVRPKRESSLRHTERTMRIEQGHG